MTTETGCTPPVLVIVTENETWPIRSYNDDGSHVIAEGTLEREGQTLNIDKDQVKGAHMRPGSCG